MSKIALPIAELKPALTGFGKIISKRTTLPVLNHIKIERTKDGWIALTGTDLDVFATLRLEQPAQGEPLSLLVPFDELLKITKTCGKTDTILIMSEKVASVPYVTLEYAIGNQVAETKVASLPVEEFPPIPKMTGEACALPDGLRESLHQAFDCASTDETRHVINSAYVDVSDAKCHHVVGTDGRHLYASNSFSLPLKNSVIIPSHKFLGWKEFNHDGEWQMRVEEKPEKYKPALLQLSSRRWRFITRQCEGKYPDWRQVLPAQHQFATTFEIDPATVPSMIQTIQRMPCDDEINLTIGLEYIGKKLRLLGKSPNADKWTKVDVEDVKGKGSDVTIYLNRHLLTKALTFGLTTIDVVDPMTPLRFSNGGRQIIVMPINPNGPKITGATAPKAPAESAAEQPAASPQAANHERSTMPKQIATPVASPASTKGSSETSPVEKSSIEAALIQIESIKGSYRDAIRGLNDLTDTLKQVQRDQKSTEKDVQSVRSTLEKLQRVQL